MHGDPQTNTSDESFYSIDNSRTDFTVIESPPPAIKKIQSSKLVSLYGIKQSSAVMEMSSERQINETMHSIYLDSANQFQNMNIHEISGINQTDPNLQDASDYLQKQIKCLRSEPSVEEIQELEDKIEGVKNDQTMIKRQIENMMREGGVDQLNMQELMQENMFSKKKTENTVVAPFDFKWPDPQQLTIKTASTPSPQKKSPFKTPTQKHYDIRPNQTRSLQQQRLNNLYKSASFNTRIVLLDDPDNQYRIEVTYQAEEILIDVVNYTKGQTNFVYAVKINEEVEEGSQRISEKLTYPMKAYVEKKFTVSLNILLLFFEERQPKEEKYLLKIQQIRTISVPYPMTYLIQNRFVNTSSKDKLTQKILPKLHIYDINIDYGIDLEAYQKLSQLPWVTHKWFSLKGSSRLLYLQLSNLTQGREQQASVSFRVGVRQGESQEGIDLIEYLCFMLVL